MRTLSKLRQSNSFEVRTKMFLFSFFFSESLFTSCCVVIGLGRSLLALSTISFSFLFVFFKETTGRNILDLLESLYFKLTELSQGTFSAYENVFSVFFCQSLVFMSLRTKEPLRLDGKGLILSAYFLDKSIDLAFSLFLFKLLLLLVYSIPNFLEFDANPYEWCEFFLDFLNFVGDGDGVVKIFLLCFSNYLFICFIFWQITCSKKFCYLSPKSSDELSLSALNDKSSF